MGGSWRRIRAGGGVTVDDVGELEGGREGQNGGL